MKSDDRWTSFNPGLFSHGRLFYRFDGSDACRFSPKLAWRLLEHIRFPEGPGRRILWDPFCGTGLLLCVARAFFSDSFDLLVGSDAQAQAVEASAKNLQLLDQPEAQERRMRELVGMQGLNARSAPRWREVELYYKQLLNGLLKQLPPRETVLVQALAQGLPATWKDDRVFFIGDLPYGRSSAVQGGCLAEIVTSIRAAYPQAHGLFVASEPIALEGIETMPLRGGRCLIRF